jgi:hypothetical protein
VVLSGLAIPASALAQEPAASFADLSRWVRIGDQVVLTDAGGRKVAGRIADLQPDRIRLATAAALRDFPEPEVRTITRREPDSLRNGALIGAGVGAGLFLTAVAASGGCEGEPNCGGIAVVGTLIYLGVGAGIGAGIDALVPGRQAVIFRAPGGRASIGISPRIRFRGQGIVLSVAF